jgi:hypothetical protein
VWSDSWLSAICGGGLDRHGTRPPPHKVGWAISLWRSSAAGPCFLWPLARSRLGHGSNHGHRSHPDGGPVRSIARPRTFEVSMRTGRNWLARAATSAIASPVMGAAGTGRSCQFVHIARRRSVQACLYRVPLRVDHRGRPGRHARLPDEQRQQVSGLLMRALRSSSASAWLSSGPSWPMWQIRGSARCATRVPDLRAKDADC